MPFTAAFIGSIVARLHAERFPCPDIRPEEEMFATSVNEPVQVVSEERHLISSSVSSTVRMSARNLPDQTA
jgi:hypothetical protein